jgi:hypothetical protein
MDVCVIMYVCVYARTSVCMHVCKYVVRMCGAWGGVVVKALRY